MDQTHEDIRQFLLGRIEALNEAVDINALAAQSAQRVDPALHRAMMMLMIERNQTWLELETLERRSP